MRTFASPFSQDTPQSDRLLTSFFKWSFDDKFVGRIDPDVVTLYELPSMSISVANSIKAPGVRDFAWSPVAHILAYFTPETSSKPATVILTNIVEKALVAQKNFFHVVDVNK